MSDISPISRPTITGPTLSGRGAAEPASVATSTRGDDKVELSRAAQLLSKLSELPQVRQDVVDRVKSQIANGTYETPEKIEGAIDNLAQDLN